MIPNGKEMNWNGHHLVFESENDPCRGCFFADKDECPECDEGLWVEENPSPWHTGKPTEQGWYLFKWHDDKERWFTVEHLTSEGIEKKDKWDLFDHCKWQKIEETDNDCK